MTALELLAMLYRLDVKLTPWVDRLRVNAPPGVLTDDLRQVLRTQKGELLALVEEIEERLAIAHYCGGLSIEEAERLAWQCVLEEVAP